MARKLKIQAQQTKTIAEAFSDFLLCKKALGVSDKTLKTYSQHFSAICKYLDSSAPIGGLFKRPLEEMIEQMRSSNLKDTSINSYTRTLKSFLSWCNEEGLTETNISLFRYQEVIKETYSDEELRREFRTDRYRRLAGSILHFDQKRLRPVSLLLRQSRWLQTGTQQRRRSECAPYL